MVEVGSCASFCVEVCDDNTAKTMKSGELDVFATPALVAAMEAAAVLAVSDKLNEGESTVGTGIKLRHIAPSVPGSVVTATAELIHTDGRRLVFKVSAADDAGLVGEGEHERFIINKEKFMSKAIVRSESNVK